MLTPDGRIVEPQEETLPAGSIIYRVHSNEFGPAEFNPGTSDSAVETRFAFFGQPPVPVLYCAATPDAAISETILHDVPVSGGRVDRRLIETKILSPIVTVRPLRLLCLHGHGFRRVGVLADNVTRTSPRDYSKSVPWAEAGFNAGFDGICWMSRHHDTSKAYVFFQRGTDRQYLEPPEAHDEVRAFAFSHDLDWLSRQLAPLNIVIVDP